MTDAHDRYREQAKALAGYHNICEDPWYSCPLSEEGCWNEVVPKDVCTCGYDGRVDRIAAALAAAAQPVWTTEKPTQPGWYWWRLGPGHYAILERYDTSSTGLKLWNEGKLFPILDGQFAGPLQPPKEKA